MRKNSLLLILPICFIVIFGCVGMEIDRGVKDNVFYSTTLPTVYVKTNPNFEYIGEIDSSKFTQYSSSLGPGERIEKVSYILGAINDQKYLDKGVIIKIQGGLGGGYWISNRLFSGVKNPLSLDDEKVEGKSYKSCTAVFAPFLKFEHDFITSKGYRARNWYLTKTLARLTGSDKYKIYIVYFESSDNIRRFKRAEWEKPDLLRSEQRDILRQFINNADDNMKISKTHDFSAGKYENTSSSKGENKDIEAKLKKLKELLQKDLITREEYDQKKKFLLENL